MSIDDFLVEIREMIELRDMCQDLLLQRPTHERRTVFDRISSFQETGQWLPSAGDYAYAGEEYAYACIPPWKREADATFGICTPPTTEDCGNEIGVDVPEAGMLLRGARPTDDGTIARFLQASGDVGDPNNIWCLPAGPSLWHEVMLSRRWPLFHAAALGLQFSIQFNVVGAPGWSTSRGKPRRPAVVDLADHLVWPAMPIARHRIQQIHRVPDLATIMGMFYTNIDVNDFDWHTHSPQAPHLRGPKPDYNLGLADCVE